MGTVPVLLMMAAVSITYGWHPDNRGGVEYVIQIPPSQLEEIQRIGEISSVIDPEVQGHVSRVIVKVGSERVPRITPANLRSSSGAVVAASDLAPVPIPEMEGSGAIPIPSLDPLEGVAVTTQAAVMKPQTGGATAAPGGFNFPTQPSLPPSLTNPTAVTTQGVDQAGRDMRSPQQAGVAPTAAGADARIPLVPPPSTRSPNLSPQQAPPFTGSVARTGVGQPPAAGPSTAPTASRENPWGQAGGPTLAGPRSGGPSTEPIGSTGMAPNSRTASPTAATTNSASGARGANGLSTADTFGKLPSGFGAPSGTNANPNASSASSFPQNSFGQTGSTANTFPQPKTSPINRSSPLATGQSRGAVGNDPNPFAQRNAANTNAATNSVGAANPNTARSNPSLTNPFPRLTNPSNTNSGFSNTLPPTSNTATSGLGSPNSNLANPRPTAAAPATYASPNPRLTAGQIAAGAWDIDAYGRLLDRNGQLLQTTSNPNHAPTAYNPPAGQTARAQGPYPERPSTSLGQPSTNPPVYGGTSNPLPPTAPYGYPQTSRDPDPRLVRGNSGSSRPPLARNEPLGRSELERRGELGPPLSDRSSVTRDLSSGPPAVGAGRTSGSDGVARPVASQPFFNTLLLLSFVANVYLVFWLKNLRVQFHDLVAAKRMASSSTSAT